MFQHFIISQAHTNHVVHKHGGGFGDCKKSILCRFSGWLHTSIFSPYPDTCALCGKVWHPDFHQLGYQWVCNECRTQSPCQCESDDVVLDWHIVSDQNGDLCSDPMWCVECCSCEIRTAYFETAKEAADAWSRGEVEMIMEA